MRNTFNSRTVTNHQENLVEWLLGLHPTLRFVLGLFVSAVSGWYVPQLFVIFATGIWAGSLGMSMWLANAIGVGVLMTINLIGNKLSRILLIGMICAGLLGCYEIWFIARTMQWTAWQSWIAQLVAPPSILLLNAYFLVRYKRFVKLEN